MRGSIYWWSWIVIGVAGVVIPGCGDDGKSDTDAELGSTDGDGDGDGDPNQTTYSAQAMPGGLDRVFIDRHDHLANTCTRVVLVAPGDADINDFEVTVPIGWAIEYVTQFVGADCSIVAPGGAGSITFITMDRFDLYPCALDLDADFELMTDPPSSVSFVAADLTVDGTSC